MSHKGTDFSTIPHKGGNIAQTLMVVQTDAQPAQTDAQPLKAVKNENLLEALKAANKKILEAAAGKIVFSPAWVYLEEVSIFTRGTINMIQGRTGSHKSRLAERFCSLLLGHSGSEFVGFKKNGIGHGYCVIYIDTERNTGEDFAACVQRVREAAGYEPTDETRNFYPVSIKGIDRQQRLEAVRAWIEYVRADMVERGVGDWNLFVTLDVVTDCVRSFNNDGDSLALFDYIGNLCEEFGVTFLLVMHENPGSEKARGHTGTEAMNKSNCQLQIGFERRADGEDTDIIKLRFMKTRNSARPAPIYLQYDSSTRGLVVADPEDVKAAIGERVAKADLELVREFVERFFDDKGEANQKTLISALNAEFQCTDNTAKKRLEAIVSSKNGMTDKEGRAARLVCDAKPGKTTVYRLEPIEAEPVGLLVDNPAFVADDNDPF